MSKILQIMLIGGLSSFLFVGCGGDAKDDPLPPERPSSVVSGQAIDARIKNGTIEVFPFNNFDPTARLGTTTTDDQGFYNLSLSAASQAVSVRLSGGAYIEEASGVEVSLKDGQYLYASTYYESPKPITIMVTPFTNMAHALAVWKTKQGTPVVNATAESASAISSIYTFDILSTFPINITDSVGPGIVLPLDDRARYGFLAAAMSAYTYGADVSSPHSFYTSIALAQIMYTDILSDGLLDGHAIVNGFYTQLSFGPLLMDPNTYRSELALRALEAANSAYNQTGITVTDLLSTVSQIAASTHDVFSNFPTTPIDIDPPTIGTNNSGGGWYSGVMNFHVLVNDFVGVESVIIDVDGLVLPEVEGDLNDINYAIDTVDLALAFGEHQVGVRATDLLGNEGYKQFRINVNNDGPSANLTNKMDTNDPNFTITGTYDDLGVGINSILVNDIAASINSTDKTFSVQVPLSLGQNNLSIVVTDTLANIFTDNAILNYDLSKPIIDSSHSFAEFIQINGTVFTDRLNNNNTNWPLYISADKVSLKGTPINPNALDSAGVPYFGLLIRDLIQTGGETLPEDINIQYRYTKGVDLIFDWKDTSLLKGIPSAVQPVYFPIVSEVLGDNWYITSNDVEHRITVRATDKAGNSEFVDLIFMVETYVPAQNVTSVAPVDIFTENAIAFDLRTSVFDQTVDAVRYTYPNNNDFSVLVKLFDPSSHSMSNTYETAIRENRARQVTQEEWQGDFNYSNAGWFTTGMIPVTSIEVMSGQYSYYNDVCYNTIHANPPYPTTNGTPIIETLSVAPLVYGEYQNVTTDSPLPANSTTAWTSFSPNTLPHYKCSSTWQAGSLLPNIVSELNFRLPEPLIIQNASGPVELWAYLYVDTVSSGGISGGTETHQYNNPLQSRTTYFMENEPGFPRNVVTTGNTSAPFNTTGFVVLDQIGQPIPEVLGFYRLPANSEVQIIKQVTLPTVASYNDVEVSNLTTFGSYAPKKLDKSFDLSLGTSIQVDAYIDIGYQDSGALKPRVNLYEDVPVVATLIR